MKAIEKRPKAGDFYASLLIRIRDKGENRLPDHFAKADKRYGE